jgi:hypothetical protein
VTVLLGLPFAFKVGRAARCTGSGSVSDLAIVFWATAAIFNALGLETIFRRCSRPVPNVVLRRCWAYLLLYAPT